MIYTEQNDKLMLFGLTRQEASIYRMLCNEASPLTGYEIAKITGISRSNVYSSVAALTEKGAAYVMDGSPVRYSAVTPREFCSNYIAKLSEVSEEIQRELPLAASQTDGYITINGRRRIMETVRSMLHSVEERVYISADEEFIGEIRGELQSMISENIKVVIITPILQNCPEGAIIYSADCGKGQLRIIADGASALTGEISPDDAPCSCLFSSKENLVSVLKESLKNQIELIKLRKK